MHCPRHLLVVGAVAASSLAGTAYAETEFNQTNLVSDGAVPAALVDHNLVNAWGISQGPATPFWVSDNGTGLTSVYQIPGPGNIPGNPLTVTIPPATGAAMSNPTGQVFNGTSGFDLKNGKAAVFLFASEDGAITGWNGGTNAVIAVDNGNADPLKNAVYKGLAIDNAGGNLYATNFRSGNVEMYNSSFGLMKSFTDPSLPAGYAPFNDKVIGGKLYVTFALQNGAKHDDVAGMGHGFVDVFNLDGTFNKRLITQGALNSPWGLQIAPSSFGSFAGDLLVGNFGDGRIDAYSPTTGAFVDVLDGPNDVPLSIDGLWALTVGNGSAAGGSVDTVYFSAGINGENDGLFGSLTAVPEPSTWAMLLIGFAALGYAGLRRAQKDRLAIPAL